MAARPPVPTETRVQSDRVPDVAPENRLTAPGTLAEELLAEFRSGGVSAETSFELRSRGGYARSVTGTIAYLDEEAQTFMVLGQDDRLTRVPLREIASTHPRGR